MSRNQIIWGAQTETGNRLTQFDKTEDAKNLYKFLSAHPVCIKLFQLVIKKRGYVFTELIREQFNAGINTVPQFVFERRCIPCDYALGAYNLAEYFFDKKKIPVLAQCPKCKSGAHVEEKPSKVFQTADIVSVFIFGMNCGIFTPYQYPFCPFCKREEQTKPEIKALIKTICKCGKPREIKVSFEVKKEVRENLEILEARGDWLEWYLGYAIKENFSDWEIKRNQKVTVNRKEAEIDIITKLDKNTIAFTCSVERDGNFDVEKFHLIKKVCNKLVIATSDNSVPKKITDSAETEFKNVKTIAIKDFSNIEEKLKQIGLTKKLR